MGKKILILDDEPDMQGLVERVLGQKGLVVKKAGHPREAIEMVACEEFGLLIVDFKLPGIDGLEFMRRIKKEGFDNKWMVITGRPTSLLEDQARAEGCAAFLVKPLDIHEFESEVERILNSKDGGGGM